MDDTFKAIEIPVKNCTLKEKLNKYRRPTRCSDYDDNMKGLQKKSGVEVVPFLEALLATSEKTPAPPTASTFRR